MTENQPRVEPREFRLQSDLRRCVMYVAVAPLICFALVAAANYVPHVVDPTQPPEPMTPALIRVVAFESAVLFLLFAVERYRIRVDGDGIWRRRLFRWDLWSWRSFDSGEVRRDGSEFRFISAEKSWPRRKLDISLPEDANALRCLVDQHLPPLPAPPERLTIKAPFRTVEVSCEGLLLTKQRKVTDRLVPWSDVGKVELRRADHRIPGFSLLRFHLAGQKKPITVAESSPLSFIERRQIVQMLSQFVPADRIEINAANGPPLDDQEADRRMAEAEKFSRWAPMAMWVGGLTIPMLLCLARAVDKANMFHDQSIWTPDGIRRLATEMIAPGIGGLALSSFWVGMLYISLRDHRRMRERLLRWKSNREWPE